MHDGRQTYAVFAQEERTASGPRLHGPHQLVDLVVAAEDPAESPPLRLAGQIMSPGRDKLHRHPNPAELGPAAVQHGGRHPVALADQPEQQMFGANVVVAELKRFAEGKLQRLLGARGEREYVPLVVPGLRR